MSDLVNRLRRQLTMSMFATKDDLYGQLHDERGQAADRIEQLERVIAQAREALEDMNNGWKYIRCSHGDLYGVGWDRAQYKADASISAIDEALNTGDQR